MRAFAKALGDHAGEPEQQAPRRARGRADAGAVAARSRRAGQGPGDDARVRRRRLAAGRCCCSAQSPSAEVRAVTPDSAELKARRATCRRGSRCIPTIRSPGARSARPGAVSACRCARCAPTPNRATPGRPGRRAPTGCARAQRFAPAGGGPVDFIDRLRSIDARLRDIDAAAPADRASTTGGRTAVSAGPLSRRGKGAAPRAARCG
jgi:hypothetical protein